MKIIKGKFNNITYRYNKVSVEQSSYLPKLSFHYTVLYSKNISLEHLQKSDEFVTLLGDILAELVIENEHAFGKHNYQEPDL